MVQIQKYYNANQSQQGRVLAAICESRPIAGPVTVSRSPSSSGARVCAIVATWLPLFLPVLAQARSFALSTDDDQCAPGEMQGQEFELIVKSQWAAAAEFESAERRRARFEPARPRIMAMVLPMLVLAGYGRLRDRHGVPILLILVMQCLLSPAHAELQVRMPTVEFRELEFEHNGFFSFDKDPALGGQQSYTNSIGYGVTPWWEIELEGESNSVPDSSVHYTATTIENTFQITEPGQYMFNLGFFAEYSQSTLNGEPNSVTLGPLVQKELYNVLGVDSLHTLNVLFSHDVGHNASHATGMQVAWQSRLLLNPYIDPAIEYYGIIDDLGHAGTFSQQQHFIGPVAVGAVSFSPYGQLKYEVGYMFGMTPATPRGAIRWKLEYEIAF